MQEQVGWSGNSCKRTHVHVFQCCAFFYVWRPKKYGPLTPLTNSKFEFVSAKTALRSCNSDSLAIFAMPMDFYIFACMPEATCEPHSASQWKCHTRPVVASRLPHANRRRLHRIVHERDRSVASAAANHMLAAAVCTASYVKLNLAVRQPSLTQSIFSVNDHSSCLKTRPQSYWVNC